jgi:hypothetical protein
MFSSIENNNCMRAILECHYHAHMIRDIAKPGISHDGDFGIKMGPKRGVAESMASPRNVILFLMGGESPPGYASCTG